MADRLATLLEDQSIVDPVEEYKGINIFSSGGVHRFLPGGWKPLWNQKAKGRPPPNFNIHNGVDTPLPQTNG